MSGVTQAPQRDVHPDGRLVGELDVEREAQDDEAEDEDGEYRRPIARIDEAVVEAAAIARRAHLEHVLEQLALAAARAAGEYRCVKRRDGFVLRHATLLDGVERTRDNSTGRHDGRPGVFSLRRSGQSAATPYVGNPA